MAQPPTSHLFSQVYRCVWGEKPVSYQSDQPKFSCTAVSKNDRKNTGFWLLINFLYLILIFDFWLLLIDFDLILFSTFGFLLGSGFSLENPKSENEPNRWIPGELPRKTMVGERHPWRPRHLGIRDSWFLKNLQGSIFDPITSWFWLLQSDLSCKFTRNHTQAIACILVWMLVLWSNSQPSPHLLFYW